MRIHALRTGSVKVKISQMAKRPGGVPRILLEPSWSAWLPIYAWLIEHPEGLIVVDTGETARVAERGWFPWWHPYFNFAVRFDVKPEEEIGPLLRAQGFDPGDVATVAMTHFHTDHAGGLHHVPNSRILADPVEWNNTKGFSAVVAGYVAHRWPEWLAPELIAWSEEPFESFDRHFPITRDGAVVAVPTPGHSDGHLSVIVKDGDTHYILAGDTSYTQAHLLNRQPDGVAPNPKAALDTLDRILAYAKRHPTVYLPSHDPEGERRLREGDCIRL